MTIVKNNNNKRAEVKRAVGSERDVWCGCARAALAFQPTCALSPPAAAHLHHRSRLHGMSMSAEGKGSHGHGRGRSRTASVRRLASEIGGYEQIFGSRRIITIQNRGVIENIWIAENSRDPNWGVLSILIRSRGIIAIQSRDWFANIIGRSSAPPPPPLTGGRRLTSTARHGGPGRQSIQQGILQLRREDAGTAAGSSAPEQSTCAASPAHRHPLRAGFPSRRCLALAASDGLASQAATALLQLALPMDTVDFVPWVQMDLSSDVIWLSESMSFQQHTMMWWRNGGVPLQISSMLRLLTLTTIFRFRRWS
jgi:hypothetical protein